MTTLGQPCPPPPPPPPPKDFRTQPDPNDPYDGSGTEVPRP